MEVFNMKKIEKIAKSVELFLDRRCPNNYLFDLNGEGDIEIQTAASEIYTNAIEEVLKTNPEYATVRGGVIDGNMIEFLSSGTKYFYCADNGKGGIDPNTMFRNGQSEDKDVSDNHTFHKGLIRSIMRFWNTKDQDGYLFVLSRIGKDFEMYFGTYDCIYKAIISVEKLRTFDGMNTVFIFPVYELTANKISEEDFASSVYDYFSKKYCLYLKKYNGLSVFWNDKKVNPLELLVDEEYNFSLDFADYKIDIRMAVSPEKTSQIQHGIVIYRNDLMIQNIGLSVIPGKAYKPGQSVLQGLRDYILQEQIKNEKSNKRRRKKIKFDVNSCIVNFIKENPIDENANMSSFYNISNRDKESGRYKGGIPERSNLNKIVVLVNVQTKNDNFVISTDRTKNRLDVDEYYSNIIKVFYAIFLTVGEKIQLYYRNNKEAKSAEKQTDIEQQALESTGIANLIPASPCGESQIYDDGRVLDNDGNCLKVVEHKITLNGREAARAADEVQLEIFNRICNNDFFYKESAFYASDSCKYVPNLQVSCSDFTKDGLYTLYARCAMLQDNLRNWHKLIDDEASAVSDEETKLNILKKKFHCFVQVRADDDMETSYLQFDIMDYENWIAENKTDLPFEVE